MIRACLARSRNYQLRNINNRAIKNHIHNINSRRNKLTPQKREKSNSTNTNTKTTPKNDPTTTTIHTTNNHQNQNLPAAFGIGILAGTCGSLAGMGGGFIMIPLMTSKHILSLSQHVAHGTSLFAVVTTGIAGAFSYATATAKPQPKDTDENATTDTDTDTDIGTVSKINIESAISITLCAMITARFGALYSNKLSQTSLKKVLGTFMICVSPIIPLKAYYLSKQSIHHQLVDENNTKQNTTTNNTQINDVLISGTIGLGSGFMAGLLGVGGGAVVVPALTLFTSMDHYTALGTSLAAMILPAIVGTITHYKKGNVNLRIAPLLAVGSLIGAYGGGRIGVDYLEEETMKYGFSSLLLGLGVRTLVKA